VSVTEFRTDFNCNSSLLVTSLIPMVMWPDDRASLLTTRDGEAVEPTAHAEVSEHTIESRLRFVPSTESAISDRGRAFLAYALKDFRLPPLTAPSTVVTSVARNKFCVFDGIEGLA
jgi:hypothetical protein